MAVAVIHCFSCTVASYIIQVEPGRAVPFSSFNTVLKDVKNDGQTESLAAPIWSFGYAFNSLPS